MQSIVWQTADQALALAPDSVHVWRVPLAMPPIEVQRLRKLLTPDEVARADRFKFEKHRRRFTVARGSLREIIGRYSSISPSDINIYTNENDKPYVQLLHCGDELCFNVTHSHELALVAVTRARLIGIDVEQRRQVDDFENIAQQFFSDAEVEALGRVSAENRPLAFLSCWTRKEAYIKAIGEGLTHPLKNFDVTLAPNEPAQLLRVINDPTAPSRWTMTAFDPNADYIAALCVDGAVNISYWQIRV